MANIPKITIHIDLDNLDKINDEVLLWELLRRYSPEIVSGRFINKSKLAALIPVFGEGHAKIVISGDLYKLLFGERKLL